MRVNKYNMKSGNILYTFINFCIKHFWEGQKDIFNLMKRICIDLILCYLYGYFLSFYFFLFDKIQKRIVAVIRIEICRVSSCVS